MQVNFYIKTGMLLLFLVFSGYLALAQTLGKITGIVQDEAGKGLSNVSLRLGKGTATMSNTEGGFSLRIPSEKNDTLKLAYIGYKTLLIPFSMLQEGMPIQMKPVVNQLDEVRISVFNGEHIVRNAIVHIPDNYPLLPFGAQGFYREVEKLDSNYLSFAEAGLLIINKGYGQKKLKDQLFIVKERNLKKVGINALNNPFGTALKGVPYVVLNNDLLKYPGAILGKDFIKKYDYNVAGTTIVDGEEAYLISFDQKKEVNEGLYQGTI